ncbi:FYVE zinc finger [Coleophoma cylindrospora]|uniref:FYVE zinc finger n=1 Tax=Coleophoma cylindrospora TaxID=1849047 RepID=A0A3D8QKN1_9HELO|nr:FYVE zinc finger [Coleophoma cylindrospora]
MESSRRSSRAARASQQPTNSHDSSTSSNSSGRADRTTRRNNKTESPRKSTPTASLSSEPREDSVAAAIDDALSTRRRKRGQVEDTIKVTKVQTIEVEMTNGGDDLVEDDEAVRCICGFDEYPGPPPMDEDSKHGIKDGIEIEPVIAGADAPEDLAGFFLQCDMCKVWQHGGCVGIMNEEQSPEEYFCEECRKDLHKIFTAPNGQRYSHYLPLHQYHSRNTSRAASFSKDGTRSPRAGSKNGRPSSSLQSAKRRSTMNSRDAAYDEGEALRRAIEASKGENSGESNDGGTVRRGKRGRSDSEEKPEAPKRQRTTSQSPSPSGDQHHFASQAESEDGTTTRNGGAKKIRGAAARNHREKEMREEKERIRLEAANKRKGRAERRRVDDSDHSEEIPLAQSRVTVTKSTEVAAQPLDPPSSQIAPPESPPAQPPPVTTHKKGGRPPNARKGKLGKNQYTKDKDQENNHPSPNRSQSRDVVREDTGHAPSHRNASGDGKPSRARGTGGSKVSMTDMRRRVGAILDFIQRTQLEMAEEAPSSINGDTRESLIRGLAEGLPMINTNGDKGADRKTGPGTPTSPEKEFKDLSCMEMMDVLTKQLIKWQKEYT